MKLDQFLTEREVPFERMLHPPASTATRVAECLHVPGKDVAGRWTTRLRLVVLPPPASTSTDAPAGEPEMEAACERSTDLYGPRAG